ncbi:S-layer homology domain-containing protein [Flavonifractor sp. An10]|uniref:S-layer homology domain-containing protein n=1 Tax=Flavonifractor sp. An10 TaxID=1965537 RepID=UPI0013A67CA2|nr:S-layer homology domain-containing protein [Flavonifractor sp. An10]
MKPKRIISLLLAICLVAGLMPTVAFATGSDKAIMLGASNISGYDSTNSYDYIYFGNWKALDQYTTTGPIKWRVLADQTNTGETGLFLLSDGLLGTGDNGGVYFQQTSHIDRNSYEFHKGSEPSDGDHTNCQIANAWQGSDAQVWCNTFYNGSLTMQEQGAVLATTKSDEALAASENILNGDKVFFLSEEEAKNSAYGFADDDARIANYGNSPSVWWLRTPDTKYPLMAGAVQYDGNVDDYTFFVSNAYPARPAFNLDLNSVLFTSAAVGGKSSAAASGGTQSGEAADAIFAINDTDTSEWKLTLLDEAHKNFEISNATTNSSGDTIAFSYSGAQTGTNEYISVVIKDSGAITHYGRILQLDGTTNDESGTARLTLPADVSLGENTKLYVFNEQYNGDKMTDYASQLKEISPTVDTTAPKLSNGSATRDSETTATVKFTSNEAGSYYYAVVESNEAAPTIDTTGTGTACDTTEQTISLNNLSRAGAKDIYIVAKDAVGNVSDVLKISIPAYIAPSYGISASPAALNFGSKTVDYTEAPAAQTVTLTNTGNQNVTVDLPTSTNYTVTAGTGFTNGKAALSSGGKAQFTVQPKTGLGVGDCSETLTISGSNSTSASVKLSFEVLDTYTLTVNLNGGSGSTTGGEYPAGEAIHIDAGSRSNYRFNGWTSSNGGTFTDASSASTTFTMPAADTTITANWEYNGGGNTGGSTTDYYRLTFDTNGGSEIASILRAEYTTVDLSDYKPTREGYEFTGWYADKDLTDKITSIRLTRNTTVYAGWEEKKENPGTGFENPFTDVSENDWFYDDVMFVLANDLMVGTSSTTFDPYGTTTRAMVATTIWRMEGEPKPEGDNPFTDVKNGEWYTDAIVWANENGIALGYGNNLFGTNDPVTREQLAAFFYRYAKYKGYDTAVTGSLDRFTDKGDISAWAKDAVAWAVGYGLIGGKDNNMLDPQGEATRAEFAAMLQRFCQKG